MGGFVRRIILRKKPRQHIQRQAAQQAPAGPTIAEMNQSELSRLSKIKRRGRKSTKLGAEDEDLYLSTKTLLG